MNKEVIGLLSEGIEKTLEQKNIVEKAKWAIEADEEIISIEDFTLGYVLGSLMNNLKDGVYWIKWAEKYDAKRERDSVKILGREKYNELKTKVILESKGKSGRTIKSEVTEAEIDRIRNMIAPMITQFRAKISQEYALSKAKGREK